jgi:hypothetical protein
MLCYLPSNAWTSMGNTFYISSSINLPLTLVDVSIRRTSTWVASGMRLWPWHLHCVTVQFLNLRLQLSASRFSPVYAVSRTVFCSFCNPTCDILHTIACAPSRSMSSAKSCPKRHGWRRGNRNRLSPIRSQLAYLAYTSGVKSHAAIRRLVGRQKPSVLPKSVVTARSFPASGLDTAPAARLFC